MKSGSVIRRVIVVLVLGAMVLCFAGCGAQMGETLAEGSRRHQRNQRLSWQGFAEDVDYFWLLDEPTKLNERRIP